ncbi:MAG TPA: hypothetical protein VMY42_03590 [Thermoguttaceae bacterium]|nr:hypothetical protein [Thermoguttaceae bacterium]
MIVAPTPADIYTYTLLASASGAEGYRFDFKADLATAHDRFVATLIAAVAEWESAVTSERCREVAQRLKEEGRPRGNKAPYGKKIIGRKKTRRFVDDPEQRRVGQQIIRLRDEFRLSWETISDHIEEALARYENRRARPKWGGHPKRVYNPRHVHRVYHQERKFQDEERRRADAERKQELANL